jgi:transcriptional regulator with XRE-family HTH domain
MHQAPKRKHNHLDIYRRRLSFSSRQVAQLLGHQSTSTLSNYERGERLPGLVNAFRLAIILRVPIEFLFPILYEELREEIRALEERSAKPVQRELF